MRAIIIEEDRFADLTTALELKKREMAAPIEAERRGLDQKAWAAAVEEAHRQYHFHFVRWAQSHGASCVRT